jgi:ComF family protein
VPQVAVPRDLCEMLVRQEDTGLGVPRPVAPMHCSKTEFARRLPASFVTISAMPAAFDFLRRCWHDTFDLTFPSACAACGRMVEGGAPLCGPCDDRLHDLRRMPHCPKCASPLPDVRGPCGRCNGKGIRPFKAIARLSTFESTTRDLVHAIKYGRKWATLDIVAAMLADQPRVREVLANADVLVPVPLHWLRRFHRGFNQAELLAKSLGRSHRLPIVRAVGRSRSTTSQTAFHSRQARRKNLKHAFRLLDARMLHGRRVVIVDDVMTSGATLQTVARTIRLGCRPAAVSAIVIATANPLKSDLVAI